MIDGPNGVLMGVRRPLPQESAPPPTPAPSAQEVNAAYQVVSHALNGKAPDAKNLQSTLDDLQRYDRISQQAATEALLVVVTQYDAEHRAAGAPAPKEAMEQAAQELDHEHVNASSAVSTAQHALQAGDLRDDPQHSVEYYNPSVCETGKSAPVLLRDDPTAPALSEVIQRLNGSLGNGASLLEALGILRIEYGNAPAAEDVLAQAALATQAPAYFAEYLQHPDGPDPIGLASAKIAELHFFSAQTLEQATRVMTIAVPDRPFDTGAAQAALSTLLGDQHGSTKFAADMAAYRDALNVELDAAAGKAGTAWFNDPTQIDAWLKAQARVAAEHLAPLAQAAEGTAADSAESTASKSAAHLLDLALEETRVIADVTNASAGAPFDKASPASQSNRDLAQTQRLTDDLGSLGLMSFDPKARQWVPVKATDANPDAPTMLADIANDPAIQALKQRDIENVLRQAGGTAAESGDQAQADMRGISTALAPFKQGVQTVFYDDLLDAVKGSAQMQQRFNDVAASVKGKGAVAYVHDVAQAMQGVSTPADADLSRALYEQKFRSRVEDLAAHGTWEATGRMPWQKMDAPKYYVDVSNIYGALGDDSTPAGQTEAGASLRNLVKTRIDGSHFVGQTQSAVLKRGGPEEKFKAFYLDWKDKNGIWAGNPQLFADIVASEPTSDTARFIAMELPGITDTADKAPAAGPERPVYTSPGAAASARVTTVVTSRQQLLDTLGDAYRAKSLDHPQQDGARYAADQKVYGDKTLNDLADAVLAAQGCNEPSAGMPIEITTLPILFWRQNQDPSEDKPEELPLLQVDGRKGRRFVGPGTTRAFENYEAWTQDSGLAEGMMLSQAHVVQSASGQVNLWDQTLTGPKERPSDMQIVMEAGGVMLGMAALGAVILISAEADGLLLPLLLQSARNYFIAAGVKGVLEAGRSIAEHPNSAVAWGEGAWEVAANSFTALAEAKRLGLTQLPKWLERAFIAGRAAERGEALSLPMRALVAAADNARGAKAYMALAGAPDWLLASQRSVELGAALTNGVLFAAQGAQIGFAWADGAPVSPAAVGQFLLTIGMSQFAQLYGIHLPVAAMGDPLNFTSVKPAKDRRSARVTLASGRTVDIEMLGAGHDGPLPAQPDDILLPGQRERGQRFRLMRDPSTNRPVIVKRIVGGASDEDRRAPADLDDGSSQQQPASTADGDALRARVALYNAKITPEHYRALLASVRHELDRALFEDPTSELLTSTDPVQADDLDAEMLRRGIENLIDEEARARPELMERHGRQEGKTAEHDLAVRYVINRALLAARASLPADHPVPAIHRQAVDLIVGLRTLSVRNSRSLILRDADHYLSNFTQEWQSVVRRPYDLNDVDARSLRLARMSRLVAWVYDVKKAWQQRLGMELQLPPDADLSAVEPGKIPAAAPGGRMWAALGARDFFRFRREDDPMANPWVIEALPKRSRAAAQASQTAWAEDINARTLRFVTPSPDGKFVGLTDTAGRTVIARLYGARGLPPPVSPKQILMPGDTSNGQPFLAIWDSQAKTLAVVPNQRGGATDSDPWADATEPEVNPQALARATSALYAATIEHDDYELLLAATRRELQGFGRPTAEPHEADDVLLARIEPLLEEEAHARPELMERRGRLEGLTAKHDLDVRYVINQAMLVARANRAPEEYLLEYALASGAHREVLDIIIDLRRLTMRNAQSLILRDADHYLSNLVQEWQNVLAYRTRREFKGADVRLARLSRLVAWIYDAEKTILQGLGREIMPSTDMNFGEIETKKIPAAAPGGRKWAALGTRDFVRHMRGERRMDHLTIITALPKRRGAIQSRDDS